tara:strand:- start:12 stop:212 length:201 start_codon:yes stop_codon:yes gene_type:complete
MKAGDLCRVTRKGTHSRCQYGEYVILLRPLNPRNKPLKEVLFWEVLNMTTGKWHHHGTIDLEVVCK